MSKQLIRLLSASLMVTLAMILACPVQGITDTPPGARPDGLGPQTLSSQALSQSVNDYGRISVSLDALGVLSSTGTVQINKPVGGTVRQAFLLAATTGFSNARLATGDVTLEGNSVVWGQEIASNINSYNYWADVTALVKAKLDAAPAGLVDLQIVEKDSGLVDGEILAVIFNDPGQATNNTVLLYFGAQRTAGDSFVIDLGAPIDLDDPNLFLHYSLGISYGYQVRDQQFSLVDVNGRRLTSSAGGEDDGESRNGALITVGGIGDSVDNPPNPLTPPVNARSDDELYNLEPFVTDGDTSITINTVNPSNDDNILFAAVMMGATRAVGAVDATLSLYNNPTTAQARAPYEAIIRSMADGIYESSNGAHRLGTVTIYTLSAHQDQADVVWTAACHPQANISGYGHNGLHISFCDVFADGNGPGDDYSFLVDAAHQRGGGYTLAHEWGHYFYSVYDEYVGSNAADNSSIYLPHTTDQAVSNSIMNSQWEALDGNLDWLNFSTSNNDTHNTAQFRMYTASAWETLVRPLSEDLRDGQRTSQPERLEHPELRDVDPDASDWIVIDLPGAARSALRIVWQAPTTATLEAAAAAGGFSAQLESLGGNNVSYPEPIVLLAFVHRDLMITGLGVQGQAHLPGGGTVPVTFSDDGVAPDALAGDGLYSAILGYSTNGLHTVDVTFDNASNQAAYVETAFLRSVDVHGNPVPGRPPVPVNESVTLTRSLEVVVANVVADDYGNTPALAQPVAPDNVAWPGRIDTAVDADVFAVTTPASGLVYVRVTDLALGMTPHAQVYGSDGATLLFQTTLAQQATDYVVLALRGVAPGVTVYLEVTQEGATQAGGTYQVSAGSVLASDVYVGRLFLPLIRR